MDNMDIDMVIDIPDTPDRGASRRGSFGREGERRENAPAAASHRREFNLVDKISRDYLDRRDIQAAGVGKVPKHHQESQKSGETLTENRNGTVPARNTTLFRRTTMEKDKGKSIGSNLRVASAAPVQKNPVLNLNLCDGRAHGLKLLAPNPAEGIKNGASKAFKAVDNSSKGKEKIDNMSVELANSDSNRETIDISSDPQDKKKDRVTSIRPIIREHRRLVRNGCISPQAIAARAKQPAELQTHCKNAVNDQTGEEKTDTDGPSSIGIRDIVAENDISCRAKGKRVVVCGHTSKDDSTIIIGDGVKSKDAVGSDQWRSTSNRERMMSCSHSRAGHITAQHREANGKDENESRRTVRSVSRADVNKASANEREASKRPRKNGSTTAVSDEKEVPIVGFSGESSSSRPARILTNQRRGRGVRNSVLDIDDSSPEVLGNGCLGNRCVEDDESEVRAIQMEEDERLARELQEQLYQEAQFIGDEETNENIARVLQEVENSPHASSISQNTRRSNRNAVIAYGRSRLRERLQQSSSSRGRNIPRAGASVRTTGTRGHNSGHPLPALRRAPHLRFPNGMGLDSRLNILEELETVLGQLGSSMHNNTLLQLDRDFTEDDYEMLLALDENNHGSGGTSASQINSLPQSTVQTKHFEETCAICLETPVIGDVIRHLPCFHKFHKDCIDPWLERSTSCPVCKSSVT